MKQREWERSVGGLRPVETRPTRLRFRQRVLPWPSSQFPPHTVAARHHPRTRPPPPTMLSRLPATVSLLRRSFREPRGFSSSASSVLSSSKETADGKLVASVLFERLPVVIPKIHPVVYAFQEFSYGRSTQVRSLLI